MKTQDNSMLMGKLQRQITDVRLKLEQRQNLYAAALKDDKLFEETKDLHAEIKNLKGLLKQLEAQVIISNYLAEHTN